MSQISLIPVLEHIASRAGKYSGHGTNYEGAPFKATLEIESRVMGHLVELRFRAEDSDAAFHQEATWISSDLMQDRIALWTVSSNTPGVLRHDLKEDETGAGLDSATRERRLVFRLGEPSNKHGFRQEITLDLMVDGSLEYRYAWGLPHEEFKVRTRAILKAL
jgi:hypothetical protein